MNYVMAGPSLAHTYGNVTAFYVELLKELFPKDYFSSVHIASKVAFREFNIFQNRDKEFFKKSKPMLIVRPRVEFNNSDEFLKGSYLTTRIANQLADNDYGNLQEFISDDEKGVHMKFLLNRMSMLFDVTIIVETQMEQLNKATYLKNRVMLERPFDIMTCLENTIPKDFLNVMAKETGYDISTTEGTQNFLEYLNTHSIYPITYKMKNSTGNDEFFRYYPVKLDTTISELSLDEGSKKGFVANAFSISFTISSEFYIAGLFYYFTKNPNIIRGVDASIKADGKIIPMFTVSNMYQLELPEGWKLFKSPMYKVESNKQWDYMPIDGLFNTSITEMIKYHKENNIPFQTFLNISVMKDNEMLVNGVDFEVDYDKLVLITKKVNMLSTYRLLIHVNTMYVNNLISTIYGFNEEK